MTQQFEAFYKHFRQSQMWRDMVNTRENSPWHREENVGRHTEMLIEWYNSNLSDSRSDSMRNLTLVACLFHDVGKPPAQQVKFSEDKGEYRSYAGHEAYSARMWVDYAMRNYEFITTTFRFTMNDIMNVAMMIEYHLPFGLKDKIKRKNLKQAFIYRMGERGHQAWLDFIMSDQHGRIPDDPVPKLQEVDRWMKEWKEMEI